MAGVKTWLQWKGEGLEHFRNRNWQEAINCYSSAILLNPNEAILYSNRAICENQLGKYDVACADAETALSLDSKNVKFYRILSDALIGSCAFKEALEACDKGLKLDPHDERLLVYQQGCRERLIADSRSKKKSASPTQQSRSKSSTAKHEESPKKTSSAKTGRKCQKPSSRAQGSGETKSSGYTYSKLLALSITVSLGHRQLEQKDEQGALKLYQQAADGGSPEGLYHLGLMHYKGLAGLPVNPKKAVDIWKQAAAQEGWVEHEGQDYEVDGVGESENALGNAYRDGVGVKQSDLEAIVWYYKAAQHGCAEGCSNLGTFLFFGRGVGKEPMEARKWFKLGAASELKMEVDDVSDEEEKEERKKLSDFLAKYFSSSLTTENAGKNDVVQAMNERKLQGSLAAKLYFAAYKLLDEAKALLKKKQYNQCFEKMRDMYKLWEADRFDHLPFAQASRQVMEDEPRNHLAIFIHVMTNHFLDIEEKLKLAKRCVQLDPSVADYHTMLASFTATHSTTKEAVEQAVAQYDRAVELEPRLDIVYTRAVFVDGVGLQMFKISEIIRGFVHYLSITPSDHEEVAKAYYSLARVYAMQNDANMAAILYQKGLEAEDPSVRLPCVPAVNLNRKTTVRQYLKLRRRWPIKDLPSVKMCATCTKMNCSLNRCTICKKVWYCSEKCRENNEIIHKKSCSP